MSRLPLDTSLPFFAYGTLKSSELAFKQIEKYVVSHEPAVLSDYELAVIDGLPRAHHTKGEVVHGEILMLSPMAYGLIAKYEQTPGTYSWEVANTNRGLANLVVAKDEIRTRHDKVDRWEAADDTLLAQGMIWALRKVATASVFIKKDTRVSSRVSEEAKYTFVELQATYSLLWSILERVTLFCDGPLSRNANMRPRLKVIRRQAGWKKALAAAQIDSRQGVRSNLSPNAEPVRPGSFGFLAWYEMRNNVIHRGKSASRELLALANYSKDMYRTIALFLYEESPSLARFMDKNLTSVEKDLIFIGFTQSELGRWEEENATRNNGLPNT